MNTKYNISISVAAAITSYARIYMNKFKHLPNNDPLYTDTDSVYLSKPLEDKYVGEELGQFKLEILADKAYFAAPKVYLLETETEEKIKAKGVGLNISADQIKQLINNRNVIIKRELWKKDIIKGLIQIIEQNIKLNYKLMKREKIYEDNIWIDTKPFIVINNEIIVKGVSENKLRLIEAPIRLPLIAGPITLPLITGPI